jgi:hypothetical protein
MGDAVGAERDEQRRGGDPRHEPEGARMRRCARAVRQHREQPAEDHRGQRERQRDGGDDEQRAARPAEPPDRADHGQRAEREGDEQHGPSIRRAGPRRDRATG